MLASLNEKETIMNALQDFIAGLERNRTGQGGVAVSICSAHPLVLRAAFRSARANNTFALIESTSNQVDHYGGYTGMTPADFVAMTRGIARDEGFPEESLLLGGDHLGPNAWHTSPASEAMEEAKQLVTSYVAAGYRKIHLDASFVCADDSAPLTDETVAERCADMVEACENSWSETPPVYVVGTEVPTPGGVYGHEDMHVTTAQEVEHTLSVFHDIFCRRGLNRVWDRVIGLVVQPGVEFGDGNIHDFSPVPALAQAILTHPGLAYEAHSTDYQTPSNLRHLVEHHFYILKVGPWLTYVLREGLFLLEQMEKELRPFTPSHFRDTLFLCMKQDSRHWGKYYTGKPEDINFKLAFSYSDRARYYLGKQDVMAAMQRLFDNLSPAIPESLISQYMPAQYLCVRSGEIRNTPQDLLINRVSNTIALYMQAGACATQTSLMKEA